MSIEQPGFLGHIFCIVVLSCGIVFLFQGIVGEIDDEAQAYYIWTHKKFSIGYNGNQIVDVNLTSEGKERLTPGSKLSFSYEVRTVGLQSSGKYAPRKLIRNLVWSPTPYHASIIS